MAVPRSRSARRLPQWVPAVAAGLAGAFLSAFATAFVGALVRRQPPRRARS